jgi:hypothetical protein
MDENQKHQTINEEAGLPDNWVPVDAAPIIPGRPTVDFQANEGTLRYTQASLPPGYQHDTSFTRAGIQGPNAPALGLMPLSIAGNPSTNAGIQSTAVKAAKSSPSAVAQDVELIVPNIFIPTDQTVALPGPLEITLAPEEVGTVFAAPPKDGSSVYISGASSNTTQIPPSSVGFTVTSRSWLLLVNESYGFFNGGISAPTGAQSWSGVLAYGVGGSGSTTAVAQAIVPANTVVATGGTASAVSHSNYLQVTSALAGFVLQDAMTPILTGVASGSSGSGSVAVTGTPTANQVLVAFAFTTNLPSNGLPWSASLSDTKGNTWIEVTSTFATAHYTGGGDPFPYAGTAAAIWICDSPVIASTTFNFNSGTTQPIGNVQVMSVSGLTPNEGIPTFRPLVESDIPSINLADDESAGSYGGVYGNLDVSHLDGGSGASSATFWRGDGLWGTVTAGGGVQTFAISHTVDPLLDFGNLLQFNGSGLTVNFPTAAFGANFYCDVENLNATVLTVTTPGTIDGGGSTIYVYQNTGLRMFSDGTNWFTNRGISLIAGVSVKTANYGILDTDRGKLVVANSASALAFTLPNTIPTSSWSVSVQNIAAGVLTVDPNGHNLDGAASTFTLLKGQGMVLFTDGTNYFTERGVSSAGYNGQTGTYSVVATDNGKLISCNGSTFTVTLLAAPPSATWYTTIKNIGTGVVTVARNTTTIDGKSANLTLAQGDSVTLYTDGTNYFTGAPRTLDIGIFAPGLGTNNQILARIPMVRAVTFPASAPNSVATASAVATASTTFTFTKNGSSFATVNYAMAASSGTWTQASDATFAAGDVLELDGPGTADATLANVGITIQGYRF